VVNLFVASSCLGVVVGSAGGCWLGFSWFGLAGAVIGLPAGAVLGWFLPPLLVFAFFLIAIFCEEGPAGLRKVFDKPAGPPGDAAER
jgi:hypothetical protein